MMRAEIINAWLIKNNFAELTFEREKLFSSFQDILLSANEYMNLTAITNERDFAVKHYVDSLAALLWIKQNAKVIDVGTGAGFPGIPLAIMRPDVSFTLLDSMNKRIVFLSETVKSLGLENVTCVRARAEDLDDACEHSAAYDVCAARAVAKLDKLARYALPLLKPGGLLLAMKGPDYAAELKCARPAIKKYGGVVSEIKNYEIAEGVGRSIIVVMKSILAENIEDVV